MLRRKDWRRLVLEGGQPNRRLYATVVVATLRDKLRSGDIWVERSSSYRRFDGYLLPSPAVSAVAAELGLPVTADEWLSTKGAEFDRCTGNRGAASHWRGRYCGYFSHHVGQISV